MANKAVQKKAFPWMTVGIIVVALILVAAVVKTVIDRTGIVARNNVVVRVDDVAINELEFNYERQVAVNNYYSNLLSYYIQLGITDVSSLTSYAASAARDYVDGHLDEVADQLVGKLCLYKKAQTDGMTLSDEHKELLDEDLESLKLSAKRNNLSVSSYLAAYYGNGFTVKDYERMLTISLLAEQATEEMSESYTFEDKDYETYYADHKTVFDAYTYDAYTIAFDATKSDATESSDAVEGSDATEASDGAEGSDGTGSAANEKPSKSEAQALAEMFKARIEAGETFADVVGDEEGTSRKTHLYATSLSDGDVKTWLLDKERKEGDVTVITTSTSVVLVRFVSAERDEYKNIHISIVQRLAGILAEDADSLKQEKMDACKDELDKKLAAWKEAGASDEEFVKLLKEVDPTVTGEGKITELGKDSLGDAFDAWAFDESRKAGDTAVVENYDGTGYYLVRYDGEGELHWKTLVKSYLISDRYDAEYEALIESYKDVTYQKDFGTRTAETEPATSGATESGAAEN